MRASSYGTGSKFKPDATIDLWNILVLAVEHAYTICFRFTQQGRIYFQAAPFQRVLTGSYYIICFPGKHAICGLPLEDTATLFPKIEMTSLIGDAAQETSEVLADPARTCLSTARSMRGGAARWATSRGSADGEARRCLRGCTRADNGIIARDGKVPWRIKEDLKRFGSPTRWARR